jgi:hypothetical protein
MRTKLYRVFVFLLVLLPIKALSQDFVVPDWFASGQYLNAIIASDTSNPAFKAGTRVYVLHKDGIYAWNASLDFQAGSTVTFRAATGETGHYDPTIYFYPTATGGGAVPGQMSQLAGNTTFRMTHIMIAGFNEQVDSLLKTSNTMILKTLSTGTNTRIYIDNCIFKTIAGQIIRTEGAAAVINVTNSIFADMGHPTSNFGAGKFIDARNVRIDTMFVQNCTFINLYDRVIRHYQATGTNSIRNLIFDHNTVVNDFAYHGFLSLGTVDSSGSGTLQITNNLLIDHFALGMDTAAVRQVEFSDPAENDPVNNLPRMTWVMTNKNNAAKWNIQKNYFASSDSGKVILALGPPNDTIYAGPFYHKQGPPYLTWNMNTVLASQGKDTVNTFTPVNVIKPTKVPTLATNFARWILNKKLDNKNKPTLNVTANWNWSLDFERHKLEYYFDTLNCSYSANVDLGHAATDGAQIGAKRWTFKGLVSSVQRTDNQVPDRFSLQQNYPNPFNPSTTLEYSISKNSHVVLEVFNVLGQSIARLVDEQVAAGTYKVSYDASKLSSGVYLYRLKAGDFVQTMKMVLMK